MTIEPFYHQFIEIDFRETRKSSKMMQDIHIVERAKKNEILIKLFVFFFFEDYIQFYFARSN